MSFKICTIGCGSHSVKYHGPSFARYAAEHPDTTLAACCDLDEAKAIEFRNRFGFATHETDIERMLDRHKPDAVCLIVPVQFTCDLSIRILQRGIPLMMEKPPGRNIEEVDRMIAAARASGAPNQVAFNRRHVPLLVRLKSIMREVLADQPLQHVRYEFGRCGRRDEDFATTAIHGIDGARFIAGSAYRHIRFDYQHLPQFGPNVANIFMHATFENGATGHLGFTPMSGAIVERAAVHAHDHIFYLNVPMWKGLDAPGRLVHVQKRQVKLDLAGPADASEYDMTGFYWENVSFFEDIRHGRRPADDLESARQSVDVANHLRERKAEYHARA